MSLRRRLTIANLGRALPALAIVHGALFNSGCGTETNDTPPAVEGAPAPDPEIA